MRWSTVSTERSPAIARTASLIARTAPLRPSVIERHDTARPGAPHRALGLGPRPASALRPASARAARGGGPAGPPAPSSTTPPAIQGSGDEPPSGSRSSAGSTTSSTRAFGAPTPLSVAAGNGASPRVSTAILAACRGRRGHPHVALGGVAAAHQPGAGHDRRSGRCRAARRRSSIVDPHRVPGRAAVRRVGRRAALGERHQRVAVLDRAAVGRTADLGLDRLLGGRRARLGPATAPGPCRSQVVSCPGYTRRARPVPRLTDGARRCRCVLGMSVNDLVLVQGMARHQARPAALERAPVADAAALGDAQPADRLRAARRGLRDREADHARPHQLPDPGLQLRRRRSTTTWRSSTATRSCSPCTRWPAWPGFMAGSSLPLSASKRSGVSRWVHEKAGPLAIGFVICATTFSLCTQAYVIGGGAAAIAAQLGTSPGILLLALVPHALPELFALFLPLAAWIVASRAGPVAGPAGRDLRDGRDLGADAAGGAAIEIWVSPHLLDAIAEPLSERGGPKAAPVRATSGTSSSPWPCGRSRRRTSRAPCASCPCGRRPRRSRPCASCP